MDREPRVAGYYGPTDSITRVIADINANNERIPTLRGTGRFDAKLRENGRDLPAVSGDVTLLYSHPQSFRLIGKYPIGGPVFEIASNEQRYWVIVRPPDQRDHVMWYGEYANLDRIDPASIPVRPDLVLEVLGIEPIPTNLLEPPVPVMRFNNDADAYMFVWHERRPDRWIAAREIWYDRQTKLPKLVLLFDDDGRIVMRAYLTNHKPLETPGIPREQWPLVATRYDLFFPPTQSKMVIDLVEDIALRRNNAPNAQTFVFPEEPGVARIINLDEQHGP